MNEVNKTLYIPLYGKAAVSRRGILLDDPMAEKIWDKEGFELHGKAKSKWLCYYMGMRSAVFDRWLISELEKYPNAVVLGIGCGLDSRICRVGARGHQWYDLDFPEVIAERKKYYSEDECYHMLEGDARETGWIDRIPSGGRLILLMEGVSMYMEPQQTRGLLRALRGRFDEMSALIDCYTVFAAKASKYKNPINEVGVTQLYGVDAPQELEADGLQFVVERELTSADMIDELTGFDRRFFRLMFGGRAAKKIYRLFEYEG